jgi:hypothetical protein
MYERELIITGICRYPLTKHDIDDLINAFEKVLENIGELKEAYIKV